MSLSQHIPWAKNGGIKMAFLNHLFALGAHRDVVLHHGSGVGDAEIDEMAHGEFGANRNGLPARDEIDGAKLGRFGRRWVRDAHQVDEGIARTNELAVTDRK